MNHTRLFTMVGVVAHVPALLATTIAMAGVSMSFQAIAQATLDEVVVTARKREESLQDIPISVIAVSGDALQAAGIVDLHEMASSIPNFSYAQATGASDILIMRGLGTVGSGPHFEPAVGQVLNGFFVSRSRLGRSAFMDLAQIEVLKGPQGAIIGKNNSLGAVNIQTKGPTDVFEASVYSALSFSGTEGIEVEGVLSGPVTDSLRARVVVNYKDQDGYIDNLFNGDTATERDDLSTRLLLETYFSDQVSGELIWQHTDFDRQGKLRELVNCNDPAAVLAAIGDDCRLNGTHVNGNFFNGVQVGEPFEIDGDLLGVTLNASFSSFSLQSLTGFQEYDIFDHFDTDLSPGASRTIQNSEDYEQFSQEFRIVSVGSQDLNYVLGLLYLDNEFDFIQNSDFDPAPSGPPRPLRRREIATVETETISLFGQVDRRFGEAWVGTLGLRYTDEERAGLKVQDLAEIYTNNPTPEFCGGGFRRCHNVSDDLSEDDLSYNLSLQWYPSAHSMLYAGISTGFKSGGFNLRSALANDALARVFIFESEESTNFEIGGKHTLLGDQLALNWALFNTQVDDLQISSNDPVVVSQTVNNAGEASSQGVEFDLQWLASDNLRLNLAGAFLSAEFDKFRDATCYGGQVVGCVNGLQDLSGSDTPYSPEVQVTFNGTYTWFLDGGQEFTAGLKWYYVDETQLSEDGDPLGIQDSYDKFNANLTYRGRDHWYLSLVGRNLSDERVANQFEGTTAINAFGGGGRFANLEETRTYAVIFSYTFD